MKGSREQHRMKRCPEYQPWLSMVQRCTNPNEKDYRRYRGKLCAEWRDSFLAFYREIGPRPSKNHTIDRIDGARGYEPGNVRWATRQEQSRNRRTTIFVSYRGETLCIKDWAEKLGIPYDRLLTRIRKLGWSFERAISEPSKRKAP